MPTVPVNDATIYYDASGPADAPAVVLLHGFPVDGRMWDAQREALAATGHRVIVPDQRGFGRSPSAGAFTIDALADDVHALVSTLSIKTPFVLGGLSMGGYVALAYVRRYADTLRGLMLVDTKADADSPEAKENRNAMIRTAAEKGSAAIGDGMQPKLLAPDTIKHKPQVVRRLRDMTDHNPPVTLAHALAAMRDRAEQTAMLKSIRVPTLVIVGDADSVTPVSVAQGMKDAIPGAQLVVIRGAGHMSPMEQPEQVNAAMTRFLSTLK